MRRHRPTLPTGRAAGVAAAFWLLGLIVAPAQAPSARIWDGVFTAAQAERGKTAYTSACIRCHGADLRGTSAPPLTGDRFMATWSGESVDKLFAKIRDTMPPNFGSSIDDATKLDIVAFILQTGGYPAGTRELSVREDLTAMQLVRKGEQAAVQNFSLVQTVGCLERGAENTWVLTRTAEPAATREDTPPPAAIEAAASRPLGSETYRLLSVTPFKPDASVGAKMEARGLVYREGDDARLTLTSLQRVGSCE